MNGHLIANILKVSQKIEGQCLNSMNKRRGVVQLEQKALSLVLFQWDVGIKLSFVIEVREHLSCGQNFRGLVNNDLLLKLLRERTTLSALCML